MKEQHHDTKQKKKSLTIGAFKENKKLLIRYVIINQKKTQTNKQTPIKTTSSQNSNCNNLPLQIAIFLVFT